MKDSEKREVAAKDLTLWIKEKKFSYADLYFRHTPHFNRATFAQYLKIKNLDNGPEYLFKADCAGRLLDLYQKNRPDYDLLLKEQKIILADDDGNEYTKLSKSLVRFHTWFSEKESQRYKNLSDIKSAIAAKELLKTPDDPAKFGFKLVLKGPSTQTIGQQDLPNQSSYLNLNQGADALFRSLGTQYLLVRGPRKTVPVRVSSLVRSVEYQSWVKNGGKGGGKNTQATSTVMTHCNGSAFDFIWPEVPAERTDLDFVIDEYVSISYLSIAPEGNGTGHIAAAPINLTIDSSVTYESFSDGRVEKTK